MHASVFWVGHKPPWLKEMEGKVSKQRCGPSGNGFGAFLDQ